VAIPIVGPHLLDSRGDVARGGPEGVGQAFESERRNLLGPQLLEGRRRGSTAPGYDQRPAHWIRRPPGFERAAVGLEKTQSVERHPSRKPAPILPRKVA